MHQSYLTLNKISKTYGAKVPVAALKDISLDIPMGRRLAILGKSGSGKSTLLNLISLIDSPTSGRLLIDGRDITTFSEAETTRFRRYDMGFVFQFFNLIPTLSLHDNIMLPLELIGQEKQLDLFHHLVEETDISKQLDRYPEEVSGGQQQRAAIVRALVKKPRLLLADEPTGNLDFSTGCQVVELMNRICRQENITLVMVTHSMDAADICEQTIRLRDGHIINQP
jgi:ABC-type lipoprotein export system ATPase subunit